MSDETQKRLIAILAMGIGWGLAHLVTDRFIGEPEERGVKDDVKEALLKATASLASTVIASIIIRRVISKRWGT